MTIREHGERQQGQKMPTLRFEFGSELIVEDITEHPIAIVAHAEGRTVSEKREIAAEIIKRCNSHDALVAALELAREWIHEARDKAQLPVSQTLAQIGAALKQVTP